MSPEWQTTASFIFNFTFLLLLLAASLQDISSRRLSNRLLGAIAVLSIVECVIGGRIWSGALAGTIVFVLAALCWRRGWMGGGDVKLLGAVALGLTPALVPEFISAVGLAGGLLSVVYLAAKRLVPAPVPSRPLRFIPRVLRVEQWRIHRGCPLPYACAIAAGTLYVHL